MDHNTELYLIDARKKGLSIREMSTHLGKTERTVSKYLCDLGLTKCVDRTDISNDDVRKAWNDGFTIVEIAKLFHCSHDTITKRLRSMGVVCDRASGIRRHFVRTCDERWDEAKSLLDDGIAVTQVAKIVHMRLDRLQRLMRDHNYQVPIGYDVNKIVQAFHKIIDDESVNSKRRNTAKRYLNGILSYIDKYKSLPRVTQLAHHMDMPIQTVSWWFDKVELRYLLSTVKCSYLVSAMLSFLNEKGIRYDLNRRDVIHPFEIDIWLLDANIGIEINPVTIHSIDSDWGISDIYYHQKKSLKALSVGIGLVHVYDWDLIDKNRWNDLCLWIENAVCYSLKANSTDSCIDLNRFLPGSVMKNGCLSFPRCIWVNPNTKNCCFDEPCESQRNYYFRVFDAGRIDPNKSDDGTPCAVKAACTV